MEDVFTGDLRGHDGDQGPKPASPAHDTPVEGAAKRQRTSPSTKALNARALPLTRSHRDLSCAHETLTEDPGPDGDARARLNLGHGSKETARSYGYITACTIEGPLDQFGALKIRAPPGDGFLFLALSRGHVPVCALDINSSDIHTRRGL